MTSETLLFRQVNPHWVQQGRITSQVFKPTAKDKKRLSVYDGDQITAEMAWIHYNNELSLSSIGVLAVTVDECNSQHLPTILDKNPFPAHAVILFYSCSTTPQIEKAAKYLKHVAELRGWQYQTEFK